MKTLFLLIMLSMSASAATFCLVWTPSSGPGVAGYYLLSSTNELSEETRWNATRVDVGTNTAAQVTVKAASWNFAVVAYTTNGVTSDLSNVLPVEVPDPPKQLRTVFLEYNASLSSTNWQQAGFFRVRIQ